MIVKLLTERHLVFLSVKGGCTGSSESTLVKMSNCWKSHALAHMEAVSNKMVGILSYIRNTCYQCQQPRQQYWHDYMFSFSWQNPS